MNIIIMLMSIQYKESVVVFVRSGCFVKEVENTAESEDEDVENGQRVALEGVDQSLSQGEQEGSHYEPVPRIEYNVFQHQSLFVRI
jgi:hypothetical protein